jgi:DNA polymerase I/DNA polymerase-2
MRLELAFYPTDIAVNSDGITLFGYTQQDNRRIAVIDSTFLPYFFIPAAKLESFLALCKERNLAIEHFEHSGELAKLYVKPANMAHAAMLAKSASIDSFSADVPLRNRYWNIKGIRPLSLCKVAGETIVKDFKVDAAINAELIECMDAQLQDPNIVAFDIETTSARGNPNSAEDAIILAAIYSKNYKRVLTWKRFEKAPEYVEFVNSESDLLDAFFKTLRDIRPHILVGYGSDNFDFPYLLARASKYNTNINLNWDNSAIEIGKNKSLHVVGPIYMDISRFIRNILGLDMDHYKLDSVAKKLLGKGKRAALTAKRINEMWSVGLPEELNLLAEYNLVDAELAHDICKKVLPVELELAKLVGLPLQNINSATYGLLVEWFIIKSFNGAIPARPSMSEMLLRRRRRYQGGLVVEPLPGLYKPILAFDFRSLYPTIIASHNISFETMNCTCCGPQRGFSVDELGLWFCAKQEGFIPRIVKDIVERRTRINDILQQTNPNDVAFVELIARQHALKYVAAALSGYFGYAGSRFYDFNCARAVTALGRRYIQLVIKEAEKFGFKVLYGDTDGIFVQPLKKDADAKTFMQIINSVLPKPMELEFKNSYTAGLFLGKKSGTGGAKKRYALLTEAGNLILRGLEAIRGDWSIIAKRTQRDILHILLTENDVEKSAAHLKTVLSNIKQRKINLEDLAIPGRLKRELSSYTIISPRVAAAKLAVEKGYKLGRKTAVNYIIKAGSGKISDRVILAEDASIADYDVDYYIENQVLRAVYKIFETFDYDLEKLKDGQTTIGGYGL